MLFVYKVITLAFFCKGCLGVILSGSIDETDKDWLFLARFCFLSDKGEFSFDVKYPTSYNDMKLLLYFDEPDQWAAVYGNNDKTCLEKSSPPHIMTQRNQDIVLKTGLQYYWSGCDELTENGKNITHCSASRTFKSFRPRWWYIAVANCDDDKGVKIDYDIMLTNGDPDNRFMYHFSADEQGILETDIAFLWGYIAAAIFTIVSAVLLSKKKYLHTTFKMFMVSLFLKLISVFFLVVAYGAFSQDGKPDKRYILACFGRIVGVVAYLIFVLTVILLGKGYTVTRGKMSLKSEIVITVMMTLYSVAFMLVYIVEFTMFDPAQVLYIYDFWFGIGLVLLPIIGCLWLIYSVFFTLKHYREKWKFYVPFLLFFILWFCALPVIVIASNIAIPDHLREKVVNGADMAVAFVGYIVFLMLTLPCCVGIVFPYHVKTNKIGMMANAPHEAAVEGGGAYTVTQGTGSLETSTNVSVHVRTFNNQRKAPTSLFQVDGERLTLNHQSNARNETIIQATGPNLEALFVVSNSTCNNVEKANSTNDPDFHVPPPYTEH